MHSFQVLVACLLLAPLATATMDRPITKVVKLLQEMLEKSKKDGETDTELFAKFKFFSRNFKKVRRPCRIK